MSCSAVCLARDLLIFPGHYGPLESLSRSPDESPLSRPTLAVAMQAPIALAGRVKCTRIGLQGGDSLIRCL
jgi:hypothetical protein